MNLAVILIEMAAFAALFTAIVLPACRGDRKYSATAIHNYSPESWKKAFPAEKKWPAECNEARKDCFDQEFQFLKEW